MSAFIFSGSGAWKSRANGNGDEKLPLKRRGLGRF